MGARLVAHLLAEGARLVVADVDAAAVARVARDGDVEVLDPGELPRAALDVFAPCALGGAVTGVSWRGRLQAEIVCGGANNQLLERSVARVLHERSVLYAPDYVVNAGGLIQGVDQIRGYREERVLEAVSGIYETSHRVLELARAEQFDPLAAADRLAERRMGEIPRLSDIKVARTW